ncbi:MAG TPA: hypothetical protein VM935_08630, partial [Chitinophagaceae bacterium]|nr:hypothetical protein [Chitinophagaceae bacterium]
MKYYWLGLLVICASCGLQRQFRKSEFSPTTGPAIQILVPRKWEKVVTTPDSAGGLEKIFFYANGASFYVSNSLKPINPNETIDTSVHISLEHPSGGKMFKGVMPGLLYWREVQKNMYRFGYRNVPTGLEHTFDSAINFS